MFKKISTKILQIVSYFISAFACYKILSPLFENIVPRNETLFMPYMSFSRSIPSDSILQIFTSNDHFYVLLSVLNVISQRYLPEILKIHPVECYSKYTMWLLFGSVFVLLIVLAKNLFKYLPECGEKIVKKIPRIILPQFVAILLLLFVLYFLYECRLTWIIQHDDWTYAYILLPAIALILLCKFEKYYVAEEKLSKKQIIVFCSLLFINAFANEFFRFIICGGLFIGFLFHLLLVKTEINKYKFFGIYAGIAMLNCLTFLTSNFQDWFSVRDNNYSMADIINVFPDFISSFWDVVIVGNMWLFLFIALFLTVIFVFVQDKNKNKRILIYTISVIFSALLFQILLIVGCENSYNITYSFQHYGIKFLFKITLLCLNLSLLGYIYSHCKLIAVKIILTVASLLSLCFGYTNEMLNFSYLKDQALCLRRALYIMDRVFLFVSHKSGVLYQYRYNSIISHQFMIYYYKNLYDRTKSFEELPIVFICNNNDDDHACERKIKDFVKEKTGYVFTEEELEKLDFSVYDKYRQY